MRSLPALVYARGSICAWVTVFVRSMRGVSSRRGAMFLLPKNVPVATHLSSAELQPLGKFE